MRLIRSRSRFTPLTPWLLALGILLTGWFAVSPAAQVLVPGSPSLVSGATTSSWGTTPSITANRGAGVIVINVGTGGSATTGTITMPTATNGWACFAIDRSTNVVTRETSTTTTSVTFTAASAWTASDILQVWCAPY